MPRCQILFELPGGALDLYLRFFVLRPFIDDRPTRGAEETKRASEKT